LDNKITLNRSNKKLKGFFNQRSFKLAHIQIYYDDKKQLKCKIISKISFMLFGNGQVKITGVNDFDYLNYAALLLFNVLN
jgi:hypothetical protein